MTKTPTDTKPNLNLLTRRERAAIEHGEALKRAEELLRGEERQFAREFVQALGAVLLLGAIAGLAWLKWLR